MTHATLKRWGLCRSCVRGDTWPDRVGHSPVVTTAYAREQADLAAQKEREAEALASIRIEQADRAALRRAVVMAAVRGQVGCE